MGEIFPIRDLPSSYKLLIVDGVSGSGKTMISRLIDSAPESTSPSFLYELEYFCQLYSMGFLSQDSASTLIRSGLDLKFFNDSIGREVNLRPNDLSSILKSSKKFSYLAALLKNDTPKNSESAMLSRNVLSLVTHQLHGDANLLSELYGPRFHHIICIRHPYYLIDHWISYMGTLLVNPRDFTLAVDNDSNRLPWFIRRYPDLYLNSNKQNMAALCVVEILEQAFACIDMKREAVSVIDFENFVLNPSMYLSEISRKCKLNFSSKTERILRGQLVPRRHINETKKLPIYERYASGFHTADYGMNEDFQRLSVRLESQLDSRIFEKLQNLSNEYFSRFGVWFH